MKAMRRAAFGVYALGLAVGTHWPQLQIQGPIERSDLVVHGVCFGGWTAMLIQAGFFGPALSRRNVLRGWLIGLVYCVVDEVSQGLPGINRVVDPTDALANLSGSLLAGALALALSRRLERRRALRAEVPLES